MTESRNSEVTPVLKRPAEVSPTLGDLPDLLLVERARNKDLRALEALMRRYNRRLFRITRSLLRDPSAAEEAVQEAYLRAFSNLERYEPPGKFGAWLARLAFNEASAAHRRIRPDPASQKASAPAEPGLRNDLSGTSISLGDPPLDAAERRQLLEDTVDALPEVFRTVFVLRAMEQLSGVETAACLGLNETTVRTRLFRAQQRVRPELTQRIREERADLYELDSSRCDRIVSRVIERMRSGG